MMIFARHEGKLEKRSPIFIMLRSISILTIPGQKHLPAV